jgi:hypothetical protein
MGELFGRKIIETFNSRSESFQYLVDSYITDMISSNSTPESVSFIYQFGISRAQTLINNIPVEYKDEIDGLSSVLCDATADVMNDGKLSKNELYVMELFIDVSKLSQCSAVSVFGDLSETGHTQTGRVVDWIGGAKNQLSKIQAVTTIKNGDKSVVLVGYLGYLAGLTVLNDNKIFGAILESTIDGTPPLFDYTGRNSYSMDLRYALENYTSIDDAAAHMKAGNYVAGNLILLSDPDVSKVLENDLKGTRSLRTSTSTLNPGITWDFKNAIGCVNSFVLSGNTDNHSQYPKNSTRWESLKTQLAKKGDKVTNEQVKEIVSYYIGAVPNDLNNGDLYNSNTQQIIVVDPYNFQMKIFFRPQSGLPAVPVFETHDISF